MKFAEFARLCESIEFVTPTVKVTIAQQAMRGVKNKHHLMEILAMEYPIANIGSKRIQKWISSSLGIFDDELILILILIQHLLK